MVECGRKSVKGGFGNDLLYFYCRGNYSPKTSQHSSEIGVLEFSSSIYCHSRLCTIPKQIRQIRDLGQFGESSVGIIKGKSTGISNNQFP